MAEDKKEKAVTTETLIQSQSEYKGKTQLDRVTVKAIKSGSFVKEGKEYSVHPTTAILFEQKGLIAKGWDKDVKKYTARDSGTSLQDNQVTKPQN